MSASIASGDHTKIAGVAKSPGHGKIEDDPKQKLVPSRMDVK